MKTILIIDDNQDILELLALLLELEGYNVVSSTHGEDTVDLVFQYNPNLLLLDVRLGALDGREICKSLKTDPHTKHVPIIMISASHHVDVKKWLANDYVSKPFNIEDLAEKVYRNAA